MTLDKHGQSIIIIITGTQTYLLAHVLVSGIITVHKANVGAPSLQIRHLRLYLTSCCKILFGLVEADLFEATESTVSIRHPTRYSSYSALY